MSTSTKTPYDFVWMRDEGCCYSLQVVAESLEEAWNTFWKNNDTEDFVSCFLGVRHLSSSEDFPNPREKNSG